MYLKRANKSIQINVSLVSNNCILKNLFILKKHTSKHMTWHLVEMQIVKNVIKKKLNNIKSREKLTAKLHLVKHIKLPINTVKKIVVNINSKYYENSKYNLKNIKFLKRA